MIYLPFSTPLSSVLALLNETLQELSRIGRSAEIQSLKDSPEILLSKIKNRFATTARFNLLMTSSIFTNAGRHVLRKKGASAWTR